jgi:hypothetical protein
VLAKLAQALGVSTGGLLGVRRIQAAASLADDPEARRLWRKVRQVMELPDKERRVVDSLVTARAAPKEARGRRAVG